MKDCHLVAEHLAELHLGHVGCLALAEGDFAGANLARHGVDGVCHQLLAGKRGEGLDRCEDQHHERYGKQGEFDRGCAVAVASKPPQGGPAVLPFNRFTGHQASLRTNFGNTTGKGLNRGSCCG